jgi:phosphate acyltransferase
VIVTDAFVGNAVLKACESTARVVARWLKDEITRNPLRMLGGLLASGAFRALKRKADPDEYGGAVLLGINGICIKAHGASSPKAVKNAIRMATEFVESSSTSTWSRKSRNSMTKSSKTHLRNPRLKQHT